MQNRSQMREKAMIVLYQIEVYKESKIKYDINNVIKEVVKTDNEFVKDLVYGVTTYENDIDKLANKYLNKWTIDRLGDTDKSILRIGIFELVYTKTPQIVCINEAVDLAKKYSDDKVQGMINACLDKIYHEEANDER